MKCERCGKREAQFFYKSVVNGVKEERCLCSECAEREGYLNNWNGWNRWNDWEDSWFDMFSFLPRTVGVFLPETRRANTTARRTASHPLPKQETKIDTEDIQLERRRNALRVALEKAVQQEEYERAAKLRDELKQLENQKS